MLKKTILKYVYAFHSYFDKKFGYKLLALSVHNWTFSR